MNNLNKVLKGIVESLKLYISRTIKETIGEGTLETSNKTIIGAINELNKKSMTSGGTNSFKINSFSIEPSVSQIGSSVGVSLKWSYNQDIKNQTINNTNISNSLRQITYSGINSNTTYTLTGTSENNDNDSRNVSIIFCNGVYYGKSSSTTYDSNFINSLTKVLSDSKDRTITVNAGIGEYIYYCLPVRLGTPQFIVNGFYGGFNKVDTISFTNSSGYTENYNIYKSTNANLGNTSITVK